MVPATVTALLRPLELDESQNSGEAFELEIPLASKVTEKGVVDDLRGSLLLSVLPSEI